MNVQRLIDIIEAVPDDQFSCGQLVQDDGTCCALGHIGRGLGLTDREIGIMGYDVIFEKMQELGFCSYDVVERIWRRNDDREYPLAEQGGTPKSRVLGLLRDMQVR